MAREAKKDFQGPFLGFTYNGRHSSELGIVRINTGNRAEMPLSPSFKDSTAEVPGGKGLYYFNTQIQQRQFTINFAYDDLAEEDVRELREWLNPLEQGELIFDEEPYKAYMVKPNTQPKLSYLVFDREISTNDPKRNIEAGDPPVIYMPSIVTSSGRLYKGEGAIGLTAYYPYAKAPFKIIEEYAIKDEEGKILHYAGYGDPNEWATASNMLTEEEATKEDKLNVTKFFNAGDIKSPLKVEFTFNGGNNGIQKFEIRKTTENTTDTSEPLYYVYLDATKMSPDKKYIIDSEKEMIVEVNGDAEECRNDLILATKYLYIEPCTKKEDNSYETYTLFLNDDSSIKDINSSLDYFYL